MQSKSNMFMKVESHVASRHEFKIPYKPCQTAWGPHKKYINHKQKQPTTKNVQQYLWKGKNVAKR